MLGATPDAGRTDDEVASLVKSLVSMNRIDYGEEKPNPKGKARTKANLLAAVALGMVMPDARQARM